MERPSERELLKKIKKAIDCLTNREGLFANFSKAASEINDLDLGDSEEMWVFIRELLSEILPKDYKGSRPPQKSYEKVVFGHELFAFCWNSHKLKKRMYIKFVLKDERYYYISLHESRKDKEGAV